MERIAVLVAIHVVLFGVMYAMGGWILLLTGLVLSVVGIIFSWFYFK